MRKLVFVACLIAGVGAQAQNAQSVNFQGSQGAAKILFAANTATNSQKATSQSAVGAQNSQNQATNTAQKFLYSDKVISLYADKTSTKVVGRLLPTNAFEVLQTQGDRVLLRIKGFVNPAAPSVLYANDSQRLMVAAFGKNTPPTLKNVKKGSGEAWDYAESEAWAEKGNFVEGTAEMFARAKKLYMENCGICHTAHPEREFTTNQWPATFNAMRARTGIAKEDSWMIIQYLQKHSKDFKGGDNEK